MRMTAGDVGYAWFICGGLFSQACRSITDMDGKMGVVNEPPKYNKIVFKKT